MATSGTTEQPPHAPSLSQPIRCWCCERLSRQSQPSSTTSYELDLTIISGEDLKNVNWRDGPLKPYAVIWVDPNHQIATSFDGFSNTNPFWNERFTLPIPTPSMLSDAGLILEVYHSTNPLGPKSFVGSLEVRVPSRPGFQIGTYDLYRASGRPQGKIRLKLALKEQQALPNYQNNPYCSAAYQYPYLYLDPYLYPYSFPYHYPYYPGLPSVTSSSSERNVRHGVNPPSAPADYSPRNMRNRAGFAQGQGIGAGHGVENVTGVLGGLALNDELKYEEKTANRVEDDDISTSSSWTDEDWYEL